MAEDAPELEIVRSVERGLDEAERLVSQGHPEMAVVRAVSAFEIFMKRVFVEPYVRHVLSDNADLGGIITEALLGPGGWRSRLPGILRSCWDIDVSRVDSWSAMGDAWRVRNKIVHEGGTCPNTDAATYIRTTEKLMRALLMSRAAAGPTV